MVNTNFTIRSFRGGYDDNFTYLVSDTQTGTQFLIDAAISIDTIRPSIHSHLSQVLITHTHGDHITYLRKIGEYYPDIKVVVCSASVHKIQYGKVMPVDDNDRLAIGNLLIEVIHTPGHYYDSVCYKLENVLFTGDTLFIGRTGRTISTGSNTRQLYRSVYTKVLTLPGSTIIYPGHDYGPQTAISIDENIQLSPLLQAIDEDDFVKRMAQYEANR